MLQPADASAIASAAAAQGDGKRVRQTLNCPGTSI
jgi:hypothetical protein